MADFSAGQTILIDTGANLETAVIAQSARQVPHGEHGKRRGRDRDPCRRRGGLHRGRDHHDRQRREPRVGGGRLLASLWPGGPGGPGGGTTITVAAATRAHAAGVQMSGTGITFPLR